MRTTAESGADPQAGAPFVVRRRTPVWCDGQRIGGVVDVVVDPCSRTVTHLTVAPAGRPSQARLLDVHRLEPDHASRSLVAPDGAWGNETPIRPGQFLRGGLDASISAPWPLGFDAALIHPWYEDEQAMSRLPHRLAMPQDIALAIPRGTCVLSRHGHVVGRIDGFLVEGSHRLGAVVLRSIVPSVRRDIALPFDFVETITPEIVRLVVDLVALERLPATHAVRGPFRDGSSPRWGSIRSAS